MLARLSPVRLFPRIRFVLSAILITVSAACAADPVDLVDEGVCAGVTPGEVDTFAEIGATTEGIAFSPDGRLFISTSTSVKELSPDGTVAHGIDVPSALGLAWKDDALYIAGFNTDEVYRWVPGEEPVTFATGLTKPNFITATPWGTLLVSNDFAPEIYEIDGEGEVAMWSTAVASPNGMVFSADGSELYVATTFEEPGLYVVSVADGKAGDVRKLATFTTGEAPDGIALDAQGGVWVALNVAKKLVRATADGEVETMAEELVFPASLAFGQGEFDACSVYVTQLFGKGVHRVTAGVTGEALFGEEAPGENL